MPIMNNKMCVGSYQLQEGNIHHYAYLSHSWDQRKKKPESPSQSISIYRKMNAGCTSFVFISSHSSVEIMNSALGFFPSKQTTAIHHVRAIASCCMIKKTLSSYMRVGVMTQTFFTFIVPSCSLVRSEVFTSYSFARFFDNHLSQWLTTSTCFEQILFRNNSSLFLSLSCASHDDVLTWAREMREASRASVELRLFLSLSSSSRKIQARRENERNESEREKKRNRRTVYKKQPVKQTELIYVARHSSAFVCHSLHLC